jgi:hypothetical protein
VSTTVSRTNKIISDEHSNIRRWPQGLAPDQQYQGLHGISSAPFQSAPYTPHQGYGNHPFGQYHTPTVPLPNMYQISTPQAPHPGFAFPMGYPPIPSVEYHLYAMDRPEYAPIPHPTVNYQFGPPNYATSGPGIELGPTRFTFASHPALQAPTVEARSEPIPRYVPSINVAPLCLALLLCDFS